MRPRRPPGRARDVTGAVLLAVAAAALLAVAVAAARPAGAGVPPPSGEPGAQGEPGELPVPTHSPEDVRDTADEVLARPEFQRPEPNIIDKARSWVEEQIGRVLQDLTAGGGASVLGWVVLVAAIAAIAFLLARFGRTVQIDPRRAAAVSVERSRSAAQWNAEAEELEADGAWKAALRCRFRALVAALVDHGQVDDVPGRTAGEYRSAIGAALPAVAGAFAEATYLFEDAWYGDEPTGPAENRRFRDLAAEVLDESTKRRAGTVVTEAEAVPA